MRVSKKVIESIAVGTLTMALTITTITTTRVNAVSEEGTATTELAKNGIAGVAVALSGYELEVTEQLDKEVSVEKEETLLVAASAEDAVPAVKEEPETVLTEEEPEAVLTEEQEEWQDKLMADVDDFLNVRADADAESEIVGKIYKGDRALVKDKGETWTRIASGNVTGYVKNEYCVYGTEALEYAKTVCETIAKAETNGLRVRDAANAEAGIVKVVGAGEKLTVDTKAEEVDEWVAVLVGSKTCYVSSEYVTVSLKTGKAVTIEEEEAAKKAAEAAKKEKEAKAAEAAKSSAKSGQTTKTSTSQGQSLAASTDEETLLAAIIQCEAGGQSMDCMIAVGAVVLNRVHSGSYPNSIYNVIYQRGQFGPVASGKLARRLAQGVSSSARQAAQAALSGTDPTGGAKSFKLASSGHAGVVIGPVVFY